MVSVDLAQIRKYNVPGPRYTSYPPATFFHQPVDGSIAAAAIQSGNARMLDVSLYFHIPFCETLCWYCGCHTVITKQHSRSAAYVAYLEKEMELWARLLEPNRRVVQVHWGGGTPAFLQPREIRQLGAATRQNFTLAPETESAVELDPRRMTAEHVFALRDAGFHRASVGVQDIDPTVQRAVNRIQPFEETRTVVEWLRQAGFRSLNIDLIYGLPHQTLASFDRTLSAVLSLKPDRLAVFSYAHVPWLKPAQKLLARATLPDTETKFELLKLSVERLTAAGYEYIGMDHFARPGDALCRAQQAGTLQRNFQGYSTGGGSGILGLGVSSISQTDRMYWQNVKELSAYYNMLDDGRLPIAGGYSLTEEDRLRRSVIMRLMCDMQLDYGRMSHLLGIDFERHCSRELASLEDLAADGLVDLMSGRLRVTERGRLLIRNIAMRFDPKLQPVAGVYSRTI